MFDPAEYQLLDFGDGRKLEQFGDVILDRPSPAAEGADRSDAAGWARAHAKYQRTSAESGDWRAKSKLPDAWTLQHDAVTFELRPTPFGHLGIFPEQAANWDWITKQVSRYNGQPRVLNLFAYTGGSTLAAAAAGAEVVHVDSAKNTIAWARRNAELSDLADAPIRWIVEDAKKFAERELKRGNHYNAIILDPPSYGHGPKAETWKINRDLPPLLTTCAQLTEGRRAFMLLTCHSSGFGPAELEALLADTVFGSCQAGATARQLEIRSADGRPLPAGVAAHWPE
ncbi:MAG: SAM-dependent methyltransferase [Planctomycetaceae bacterium]|nr:SAM-dependent methyltransferase [Planctomycetaceae bacterium]